MKMERGPTAQYANALPRPWSVKRTYDLYLDKTRPGWTNARIISAVVDVDDFAARAWLPPGFEPSEVARATIFAAWYPESSYNIAYREAAILLHARHRGRAVFYCPWIVVDDDTALILGREMLGFPKKIAVLTHTLNDDGEGHASVSRGGTPLLTFHAERPCPVRDAVLFSKPIVNVAMSPTLAAGVLIRMSVPERIHCAFEVDLHLSVKGSLHDPLDALGIGSRTVRGHTMVMDLAVPPEPAGILPPVRPIGLVSPRWLASQLPFRTF